MIMFATLRKYSLDPLNFLEPTLFETIITFTAHGRVIKKGAFLSTNEFRSSDQAHSYLAVTFSPRFENIFRLVTNRLHEIVLENPYGGLYGTSRVWPAFGQHGGACETILVKGKMQCEESREKFPNGGRFDPFHQDAAKSDKIFVSQLAEMFFNWFERKKVKYSDKLYPSMKILDGLGVVISWLGAASYKKYAISCAYKKDQDIVDLRFWGYVWHDDEEKRKRILSKAEQEAIHFDYSLEQLKKRIRQGRNPKERIEAVLSEIHKRLIPIARNFDNYDNHSVLLPPYLSY